MSKRVKGSLFVISMREGLAVFHISPIKTILFLLLVTSCFAYHPNQDLILTSGLDAHIKESRESFEAIYYQMVEKDLFPMSYNNNLIIHSTLQPDILKEGMVVLRLIQFLEKQDDHNSFILLEKLNYLYFLELHSFLSRMNLKKDPGSKILSQFQDLYYFTVPIKNSDRKNGIKEKAPFRSALSKLFLMISIINHSQVHYEERKETLAFALEDIKREMLLINKELHSNNIDDDLIKTFVTLLEIYAPREPMMEKHNLRNIILGITFCTVAGFFVYRYRDKIGNVVSTFFNSLFNEFFEKTGEGLYKGFKKASDPDIKALSDHIEANKMELRNGINASIEQAMQSIDRTNDTLEGLAEDANSIAATIEQESPAWRNVVGQVNAQIARVNQSIDQESPAWRNAVEGIKDGIGGLGNRLDNLHVPFYGPIVRPQAQQPQGVDNNAVNNQVAGQALNGLWQQ